MVTSNMTPQLENFKRRFGSVYDAMMEQTHGREYTFNYEQLYKFMRILEFFSKKVEDEIDGFWDTLEFIPDENWGSASVYFTVLNISSDEIKDFCEVMSQADEVVFFTPDEDTICIGCTVHNVLIGDYMPNDENDPTLPKAFKLEDWDDGIDYEPNDYDKEAEDRSFREMAYAIQTVYDEDMANKNPDDYVENDEQSGRYFELMDFIEQKILESGGEIDSTEMKPQDDVARFSAILPELELEGDEVERFFDLLRYAYVASFSATTDKKLCVEFNVRNFFVHK